MPSERSGATPAVCHPGVPVAPVPGGYWLLTRFEMVAAQLALEFEDLRQAGDESDLQFVVEGHPCLAGDERR
ncbi:MAG: hypothetical protein VCC68_10985 [Myxococcota bacterium]